MSNSFVKTAAIVGGMAALGSLAAGGAVYYYDQLRDLYGWYTAKDMNAEDMEEFRLRGAPRVAPHALDGHPVSGCEITSASISSVSYSEADESEVATDYDEEEVATANTSPFSCLDDESETATFENEDAANDEGDASNTEEEVATANTSPFSCLDDESETATFENEDAADDEGDASNTEEEEEQVEILGAPRTVVEIEPVPEEPPFVPSEPQRHIAEMRGDFFGIVDVIGLHEPADGVRGRKLDDAVSDRGVHCGCLDAMMGKVRRWRDSLRRRTSKRRPRQTSG